MQALIPSRADYLAALLLGSRSPTEGREGGSVSAEESDLSLYLRCPVEQQHTLVYRN